MTADLPQRGALALAALAALAAALAGCGPPPDGSLAPALADPPRDPARPVHDVRSAVVRGVRELLAPFPPRPADVRVVATSTIGGGLVREDLVFTSADGLDVPAIRLMAPSAVARPGILLLHGHGLGHEDLLDAASPTTLGVATHLASTGFVVLAPAIRSFGAFTPFGMDHDAYAEHLRDEGEVFARLAVNDARAALEVLRGTAGVDPARIGVAGESLGGFLAFVTALVEPGVSAAVVSSIFMPFEVLFSETHHFCQHLHGLELFGSADALAASILPRRLQIYFGAEDHWFYETYGGREATEALIRRVELGELSGALDVAVTPGLGHGFDPEAHARFFVESWGRPDLE